MVGSLRVVHLFEESRRSAVVVYHSARGWLRLVNCSSKCSDRNHTHERYCCSDPEGQGDRRSDEQGRYECSQSESSHDKTLQPHFETIASRRWERLRGTIAGTPRDYDLKASLQSTLESTGCSHGAHKLVALTWQPQASCRSQHRNASRTIPSRDPRRNCAPSTGMSIHRRSAPCGSSDRPGVRLAG